VIYKFRYLLVCNRVILTVIVIILLVWYRKRTGRFNVENNAKAEFEVDNDLYGFTGKTTESNLVTANQYTDGNLYSIEKYGQPQEENQLQIDAANPLYEKSLKSTNPLYKSPTAKSDELTHYETSENCELTYDNIMYNSTNMQMKDLEYAYCKH